MQVYDQSSSPMPNGANVKPIFNAQKNNGSFYPFYSSAIINGNLEIKAEIKEFPDQVQTALLYPLSFSLQKVKQNSLFKQYIENVIKNIFSEKLAGF